MTLRIQSGLAKGRKLKSPPKDAYVRPILARIKKSLFDILRPCLSGARFLDLYSGTGAVGLEALSQGAASASFVEMDRRLCAVIEANAEVLKKADKIHVHQENVVKGLKWLTNEGPFDIIFLGPPYVDEQKRHLALTAPTLAVIMEAQLLAPNGLIIGQHHKKEPVPVPEGLDFFRQNKYGDSVLSFFRWKK
jgi:16S rRNA (guanine966-N2)-methyltransferase